MNLFVGRSCRYSAKVNSLDQKSIGRSEYRAYVVQTPNVIQDDDYRQLFGCFELVNAKAIQFTVLQFSHASKVSKKSL